MSTSNGNDLLQALRRPFPVKRIHWRVGPRSGDKATGVALAYIDARDVQQRLDDVLGLDWQCRYTHVGDKGVVCEIGLLIGDEWRWRANGAGETDVEATKGAMSDAFKRAAVMWGVGKYLYALGAEWVAIKPQGRSHVVVTPPTLPKWATPEGFDELSGRMKHSHAVRDNLETIVEIKTALSVGDKEGAAELFADFPRAVELALNKAPRSDGIAWTTEERDTTTRDEEFAALVNQHRIDNNWHEENPL